ncbi:MAG: hypothetical protein DME69_08370 [Verrucomicrobia bacterium]|nr:MAG: hypothetical protein DME69_08370 [Verrucomicrobiota bacterium]
MVDECASIDEPPGCLPILPRRRDQQWRPPVSVAPVGIDLFDQAQVDKRAAANRDSANQVAR